MIAEPRLRLELEGMKLSIMQVLDKHHLQLESMVSDALCTKLNPERLSTLVNKYVQLAIENAIEDEIYRLFQRNEGKIFIQRLLRDTLNTQLHDSEVSHD